MYHHASNKIRLTYFLILCKQILWINQIIKDNDIKGEYKVDKNKPCKLISLGFFQVHHPRGNNERDDWLLHIHQAKPKDSGAYECQINTEPKKSKGYKLPNITLGSL